MSNPRRGEAAFKAIDKDWTLKLGLNELISVQGALGITDEQLKGEDLLPAILGTLATLKGLRTFVLHALKAKHPEADEQVVGEIITDVGADEMGRIIARALAWAFPASKAGKAGAGGADDPNASSAGGTGTTSSPPA